MTRADLDAWRAETNIVDALLSALLARDADGQYRAVRSIPDDDDAHRRVWGRTMLLLAWHAEYGED